jgi:hypothetical protein
MGYRAGVSALCVLLLSLVPASAADVLTEHYNNTRTGANLQETALNHAVLRSGQFGKLWTLYADGQIVAQPLYLAGLAIDTSSNPGAPRVQGTFNAVVIATMHNTIYVYDADNERRGPDGRTVPLWATWLGPPRPSGKDIDMWSTNDPEWGILSTPVVSDDRKTLYVVAWHNDGTEGLRYKLHALDMASGAERPPAVVIGVASTDASQPCKPQSPFNPCAQKQRSALLLSNGILYVGFGGDNNRGALFAFDAASLTKKASWTPTPSGQNGGIWQSGQGPAVDADGNIYLMIANGTFDADGNGQNYGDSFVRLRLEGGNLVVQDYFTPCNQSHLNDLDLDLGSSGPVLVPGNPPLVIGGGKDGVLYVLAQNNLGKYARSPSAPNCQNPNVLQQVMAFPPVVQNGQTHYGNIHGSPVYWKGPDAEYIYAWGENSPLRAYVLANGRIQDAPKRSDFEPPIGMPGGMLSLTADGSTAGTGILWASVPLDGDANRQRGVKGIILALDAEDVTQTLWSSERMPGRDRPGLFAKFTPPTVAGGKLFVATYGDNEPLQTYPPPNNHPTQFPANYYVAVYGLMPPAPPHEMVVNQNSDDVAVVRAVTGALTLDASACQKVDASTIDCTAALSQNVGRPALFHSILPANQNLADCSLLRVTVAAKNDGLNNGTGVGFWSSQAFAGNQAADDSGQFTPKAQLPSAGAATLKSGADATLIEFVGVVNCPASDGSDISRLFKPYMQFEPGNGNIYRNWDTAANYRISRDVTGFDRSGEVLRQ